MNEISDNNQIKIELIPSILNLCYNYSVIIIKKYKNLITTYIEGYEENITYYDEEIEEIKRLILIEHKLYKVLISQPPKELIPQVNLILDKYIYTPEYMRFKNKLQFMKNISYECKITPKDLSLNNIPENLDFDIFLSILAYIYINTFKSMKEKLDSISENRDEFIAYIDSLYKHLHIKLIHKCCGNDLFENIVLFNEMDIDLLPDLDIFKITSHFKKTYKYTNIDDEELINDTLFNLITEDINKIKQIKEISDSPKEILEYLYNITRIEVIISTMNKRTLKNLAIYCNKLRFQNLNIANNIKKLVRNQIKED